MKEYYASPQKIIGYLAVAAIITLPVALGFIVSQHHVGVTFGVIIIVMAMYPVVIRVKYPVLLIGDGVIVKRNLAGIASRISMSSVKELVVSVDYLAFRTDVSIELSVDKGWFSQHRWKRMVKDLESMFPQ